MKEAYPKYLIFGILLGLITLSVALLFYILNFQDHSISKDPAHWGQFADYLNAFVSLANSIVIVMLTIAIHRNEQQREKDSKYYEQQIERPIMVFEEKSENSNVWGIINVGRGPALDVTVLFDARDTSFPHFLPKRQLELCEKLNTEEVWEIWYKDIFDNRYVSSLKNRETKIKHILPKQRNV